MSRRPLVGITGMPERARYGSWEEDVILLDRQYSDQVTRAGGLPVLLPPGPYAQDVVAQVDGIVITGGCDVGESAERDDFELALARLAMERDVPLLGVCRGMQVMNVAQGGTLVEHLPDVVGHESHRLVVGSFGDHDVRLEEGSLAALAAGEANHAIKSHHHQGVDAVGEGFVVTGWATDDDFPEAIEAPGRRFALGVQWHPEADERSRVIAAFVEACRG